MMNTIEIGKRYIMPDPKDSLGDGWSHGGWVGEVIGFRRNLDNGAIIFATVEDADGYCFDIETERLNGLETNMN